MSDCPACDPTILGAVEPGERCFLCDKIAPPKLVDGRGPADESPAALTGKPSTGAKSAGVRTAPRPKAPAKKKRSLRGGSPSWLRAIYQPILAIVVAGFVIYCISLLIGAQ